MVTDTFLYLYTCNCIQGASHLAPLKLRCTVWQYKQVQNRFCYCYHWSLKIGRAVEGYSHMAFHLKQKKWTGLVGRNHMKMMCFGTGEKAHNIREVIEHRI